MKEFFHEYGWLLVATILFEIVLGVLFYRYVDLYLLPQESYIFLAILLPVTTVK